METISTAKTLFPNTKNTYTPSINKSNLYIGNTTVSNVKDFNLKLSSNAMISKTVLNIIDKQSQQLFDVLQPKMEEKLWKEVMKFKLENQNPINSSNFQKIKTGVFNVAENPLLNISNKKRDEIKNINTSEELWKYILNLSEKAFHNYYEKSETIIEKYKNNPHLREKMEQEDIQTTALLEEYLEQITDLITPESNNPDVIAIEKELKGMGVTKIKCANNLDFAKNTKIVLEKAQKYNVPMPYSIVKTNILGFLTRGITSLSDETKPSLYISSPELSKYCIKIYNQEIQKLKQSNEFKLLNPIVKQKTLEKFNDSILNTSINQPLTHIIAHELGHSVHKFSLELETTPLSQQEKKICKNTNNFLAFYNSNPVELQAEIFALLLEEKELSNEQIELYKKFNGFMPKFVTDSIIKRNVTD